MTAMPASWWQPYSLCVYHREMPGGMRCLCGCAEGDVISQAISTGPEGMDEALGMAKANVDDGGHCAGWYEASGPSPGFDRTYP